MDRTKLDGTLEQAAVTGAVPGVVAVVGDRDGTLYEGAFGQLSVEDPTAVAPDTIMAIASMTKAIASVAALQLLEQGQLDLQAPVETILPAFGELKVLEGFDGDQPRLREPARQATVRNLLTHTSGLSYWFGNADLLRYHTLLGIPDPSTGLRGVFEMPLIADPGTRWEYGTSTDWLGQVVEAVSGKDLQAYCDRFIFGPLGMTDTTFVPSDAQLARRMAIHARMSDGALVVAPLEMPTEPEYFSGGGGAVSTGPDYLRFMRALLRGGELDGERILSSETVDLMFEDHLDGIPLPEVMHSVIPELSNDVPSMPVRQGFGLGLHLTLEDIPGMRRAGTGDWAGLFNCYYWVDRATGIAGAIMTQVLPFFDMPIVQTALGFEAAAYAEIGAKTAA